MSITYGIIALISLCMVGACVLADKKRDVWLLCVFVSVSLCNLGYFMTSISKDLGDALNSNRIAYLGSVFLPYFLLMMVLRFCGIKRSKLLTTLLAVVGVGMLAITTSPGILPIYYSSVDIAIENGTTSLIREYGPLHLLHYVYLIGYMLSMIGVALYAIAKRKIRSSSHTVLLLSAVFCNITIWLVEQFLPRGFEWLSVSYIITECLMLAIYRSMQRNDLMLHGKKAPTYTINVLLVVPTTPLMMIMSNLSSSYIMMIAVFTLLGWCGTARMVRAQVLSIMNMNYIRAAELAGGSKNYIMFRHIMPAVSHLLIMNCALSCAGFMIAEAGLSFIGLGDPSVMSWGKILVAAQESAFTSGLWAWVIAPGVAIFITVLGFMQIGSALEEIFNPKIKQKKLKTNSKQLNADLDVIFASMADASEEDAYALKKKFNSEVRSV